LRDSVVLADAIHALVGQIDAAYGFATGPFGNDGYPGLTLDRPATVSLDSDAVLVVRAAAEAQRDRNAATIGPASPATSDQPGGTRPGSSTEPGAASADATLHLPTRFHATVELDPTRPGPLISQIAQSILVELARGAGSKVRLRLDIEGEAPEGYPDDVVSVVTENAATLRIQGAAFERE
ncbi:MAG: hypothetical protein DI607_04935, partial [Sphingomonas hengshuiensis]